MSEELSYDESRPPLPCMFGHFPNLPPIPRSLNPAPIVIEPPHNGVWRQELTCTICGKPFIGDKRRRSTCSAPCAARAKSIRKSEAAKRCRARQALAEALAKRHL